jgi:hypothetical protein
MCRVPRGNGWPPALGSFLGQGTSLKKERMKLIVNRQQDPKKRSEIRRGFAEKDAKAYMLLLELLSHQSGFCTSQEYLRELLGWTDKVWKTEAKKLEERGHLFRYRQTGTNNWTFIVHEKPQSGVAAKPKKEKKEELAVSSGVPEQAENSLFTPEEWELIHTTKKTA